MRRPSTEMAEREKTGWKRQLKRRGEEATGSLATVERRDLIPTKRASGWCSLVCLLIMGLGGCAYTQPVPGESSPEPTRRSRPLSDDPWYGNSSGFRLDADREACELAILATGDVEPPEMVWRTIREDLDNIRQFWSVAMPEIRTIAFRPAHETTALVLAFDFGAAERVRERTYDEWDELNRRWGATPQSIRDLWDGRAEVTLVTNLCVDLTHAIREYRFLYGVSEVYPPMMEEDGPTIYIDYDNIERRYIFRDAWGTCGDGCDENRYAYFKISGLAPHFQEVYDPRVGSPPVWWEEANEIMRDNRQWERRRW